MTNKILIDGWNVAWKIDDIRRFIPEDLQRARSALNTRVKSFFAAKKTQYKMIYDGKPGITGQDDYARGIDVRFSKDPEKADHLIVKYLLGQSNPRQWTVITSDKVLGARVRSIGADVLSSESFIQKMTSVHEDFPAQEKHDPQLDRDELNFWLDQFNTRKKTDEQ